MTEITDEMVQAALRILRTWGGLRDRDLDEEAIVRRMLVAAAAKVGACQKDTGK